MTGKQPNTETVVRGLFCGMTLLAFLAAILSPDRADMFRGLVRICTSSGQTIKSFFDPSYGGYAGTFLNLALVCTVKLGLYCLPGVHADGKDVMPFVLTAGFCFWGMTILNIWFSFAGVLLYAWIRKKPIDDVVNIMLFSTGLSPLITELLFRYPGSEWHGFTLSGIVMALAAGIVIGVMISVCISQARSFHKGYSLYGAAVPMGFLAFFLHALLYKVLTPRPPMSVDVGLLQDSRPAALGFCCAVFGLALLAALLMGGAKRYGALLRDSGYQADFAKAYGPETALLNFGIYGFFIVGYYLLVGAVWNGATLGVVFCMVCCAFSGSHPRNVLPILLGYAGMSLLARTVCGLLGTEFTMVLRAQDILIGVCYASGLAPVAGRCGPVLGALFAAAHYVLVTCFPSMHSGFLLYNGGFTAGVVCFLFYPAVEFFAGRREQRTRKNV